MSDAEKDLFRQQILTQKRPRHVPWMKILTSPAVWALCAGKMSMDWIIITIQANLPRFYRNILDIEVQNTGLYTALPFTFALILSNGVAWSVDNATKRQKVSNITARKTIVAVSTVPASLLYLGATYAGHDQLALVVACMVLAMGLNEMNRASLYLNTFDITSNY